MNAEATHTPVCAIIGGPNGSGKSTIYDRLALPGRFINADVIAKRINPGQPEAASLLAGRRTLEELERAIEAREDFTYETTLSSQQSIGLMRAARDVGYEVGFVFVALRSADLNVERVANRVARGGHDIPEHVIRRRYETSLTRLPDAIRLADGSMVFDNTLLSGPCLLLQIRAARIEQNFLDAADGFHGRLAVAASKALAIPVDAVFRAAQQG